MMVTKAAHDRIVHLGDQIHNLGGFAVQALVFALRVALPILFTAATVGTIHTAMKDQNPRLVIAVQVFAGLIALFSIEALKKLLDWFTAGVPEVKRDDR